MEKVGKEGGLYIKCWFLRISTPSPHIVQGLAVVTDCPSFARLGVRFKGHKEEWKRAPALTSCQFKPTFL